MSSHTSLLALSPQNADCFVYTQKDGMLSAVAHDLKLEVRRWSLQADPVTGHSTATFYADSLTPLCAMKDGRERPGELSASDLEKIRQSVLHEVLDATRFPEIRFVAEQRRGDGAQQVLSGSLTLKGKTRPFQVTISEQAGLYQGEGRVNQPDFGIRPFSALLGALKVRPEVRVVIRQRSAG